MSSADKTNRLKIILLSTGTALFFSWSLYLFLNSYYSHSSKIEMLQQTQRKLNRSHIEKRETEKHNERMSEIRRFTQQVEKFGLTEENWMNYEVNINSLFTFREVENILNQTNNTLSYYFQPVRMELSIPVREQLSAAPGAENNASSADNINDPQGDLHLALHGTFFVMQQQ